MHELLKALQSAKHILIIIPIDPNIGAVGSALAMYVHTLRMHKKSTLYCKTQNIDSSLRFLPFFQNVRSIIPSDYDLVFSFDCSSYKDLGVEVKKDLANIDCHLSNEKYGRYNLVDSSALSTAQVLYEFFKTNNISINAKMATALYAGIISDSNSFTSKKVCEKNFKMATELLQCGAEHALCVQKLFKERSLASMRLKGLVLSNAKLFYDARIISAVVDSSYFERSGASFSDCKDVLIQLIQLANVEVALIFCQIDTSEVEVVFHFETKIDIDEIISTFGKGRYKNSSSFIINAKDLKNAQEEVVNIIKEKI